VRWAFEDGYDDPGPSGINQRNQSAKGKRIKQIPREKKTETIEFQREAVWIFLIWLFIS
jgi:hypothetical protein